MYEWITAIIILALYYILIYALCYLIAFAIYYVIEKGYELYEGKKVDQKIKNLKRKMMA